MEGKRISNEICPGPGAAPPTVHRESGARDEQSPVQRYESPGALSIYPNHDKHCACSSPHMMLCIACSVYGWDTDVACAPGPAQAVAFDTTGPT